MRREELYLSDIIEAADAISGFLHDVGRESFLNTDLVRSAVLHKLTVIGEAVSRLPTELKDRHPEVQWRKIAAFRNFVVHVYFAVKWEIVWVSAAEEVPVLRAAVAETLAREYPPQDAPPSA